ncbi:hypothetical protein PSACC_00056 [Paramicrosporidium saccamoebae]|uniref:Uncharacterized protein n=1 Tax=Paramicrosporidium saccamoebae TaxID=1246581 RepID=A0A2H9TR17_9FUNG|nr:hypothetical protein PSACC_00056 [Paramicrosporidium saccamoebae]
MRQNFTLNALHRLGARRAKILCLFLLWEHPKDVWIKTFLSRSGSTREKPPSNGYKPASGLELGLWRSDGEVEECRLCGCRPSKGSGPLNVAHRHLRSIFCWIRRCKVCMFRIMKLGLRSPPEEGFGLQELGNDWMNSSLPSQFECLEKVKLTRQRWVK